MTRQTHPIDPASLPYIGDRERGFGLLQDLGVFRQSLLRAEDGVELRALSAGSPHRPTVLLVNALGVSGVFMAPLARRLAEQFHVLSWESRVLPNFSGAAAEADCSLERHCLDALRVLEAAGVQATALVSYCSGSNVAACAIARGFLRPGAWCAVSPSISLPVAEQTPYQRTMLPLWKQVAERGARQASLVRALIARQARPQAASGTEQELEHLNNLPFATAESTLCYARLQAACLVPDWAALLREVDVPTLVLHAVDDDVIHRETSAALARHVRGATFQDVPQAGHFAIHTSSRLHHEVAAFVTQRAGLHEDRVLLA